VGGRPCEPWPGTTGSASLEVYVIHRETNTQQTKQKRKMIKKKIPSKKGKRKIV
jgi:hypothetical protein